MDDVLNPQFLLPRATPGGDVVAVDHDVGRTFTACARLGELAGVTSQTAPELLAALLGGRADARKAARQVTAARSYWKLAAKRARSQLRLQFTDVKMVELGYSPSNTVRDSLVDVDPAIKAWEDGCEAFEEMVGVLQDRAEALHEGINAVKKIVSMFDKKTTTGADKPEPFANIRKGGTINNPGNDKVSVPVDQMPAWMGVTVSGSPQLPPGFKEPKY